METYLFVDNCDFVVASNMLRLNGWAHNAEASNVSVEILINTVILNPTVGLPRPDVPAQLGEHVPIHVGFELNQVVSDEIANSLLADQEIDLVVTVFADGHAQVSKSIRATHHKRNPPVTGSFVNVDVCEYRSATNCLTVQGWCYLGNDQIKYVLISIGNLTLYAQTHLERPDVQNAFAGALPIGTGFSLVHTSPMNICNHQISSVEVEVAGYDSDPIFSSQIISCYGDVSLVESFSNQDQPSQLDWDEQDEPTATIESLTSSMTLKSNCTDGVLVFTNSLHYGGGQTYIIELLKLLLQRNVISQPVLVMSEAGGPMRSHLTNLGILTEPMILPSFTELAELESWVRLLIGRIESHRPRKIILNTLGMWPVALAAIAIGETPVWSIHESFSVDEFVKLTIPNSLLHHNVVTLISEALHRSRLIFEARSTADIVLGHSWESHPHLTIAGYYISDISRVLADPHVTQWPENSRILSVGTMEPRKNQLAAISLIRRLENLNYNPYLTLVGARLDQSYTKAVINDIETLGLDDRVEIVEVTHDLDPWYQSSQFYLSTSDVESMPITVLLAMAHGLICIVPELFGLGELIEDGITGFLYERRNWESAISSIQRAFKLNHSERIQMIIEARKKVAIYMDVDRITSIFQ